MELTTVTDSEAIFHADGVVHRIDGLEPDTAYEHNGVAFRTLPRPDGELRCRFATVNDIHFGETVCGLIEGVDLGPVFTVPEGADPYPEVMNRGAIAEMAAVGDLAAVVVKGDLTADGTQAELDSFLANYGTAFGDRLHWVRGNHESYNGEVGAGPIGQRIDLPGITLALLDTSVPGDFMGRITPECEAWLDDLGTVADQPVMVLGHHHSWNPSSKDRPDDYFGIRPDDSERLVAVFARHPNLIGYWAGHTHRNRVRRFSATGDRPWVEVACVKDFPGTWAEYRVYDSAVMQVHRRISTPEALAWTEQTRHMFGGTYFGYAFGALEERCFLVPTRPRSTDSPPPISRSAPATPDDSVDASVDEPDDAVDIDITPALFARAAGWYVDLVGSITDDEWDRPGLGEWSVRELVGHTTRALLTVTDYLVDGDEAMALDIEVDGVVEYFHLALAPPDIAAAIAQRGRDMAADLGDDPATAVRAHAERTLAAVAGASDEAVCRTIAGVMWLSDFLDSRIVELILHGLDLCRALDRPLDPPGGPAQRVLDILAASVGRADRGAVLLALAGRTPLPSGYTALG